MTEPATGGDPFGTEGAQEGSGGAAGEPPHPKPPGAEYGYLSASGEPVASTREHLLQLVRARSLPPLVWAPDTPAMVRPWHAPFILDVLRDDVVARTRRELHITTGGAAVLLLAFWLFTPPAVALMLTVFVGAFLLVLVSSVRGRVRQAERLTAEELSGAFDALVSGQAVQAQPLTATRALGTAIAAVGVVQLFAFSASLEAGALRRDAVAAGEWWRLLTAPMLHGHILHFWLNYMALEGLGSVMELRGVRAWVPIVFVGAALAGGAASLGLPPDVISVGASGGLMGMFGFLAVMAYRRKRQLPPGFLRRLMLNIALIAVVGAVAYRFIDNAAHGGGLLAGALIGFAAIPPDGRVGEWTGTPALDRAGRAATAFVWLWAAIAILVTLSARFGR